jgi:glycosyltransferase involved in cell wall biosynthesis
MMRRRLLYVHNGADLYGASRCLLRLVQALDRSRFIPIVVLPWDGPLRNRLETIGVEVVFHPELSVITRPVFRSWRLALFLLQFPISVLFLWRLIKKRHIDLVSTNTGVIISPALAAKLAGVPHICHIRDWFQEFRQLWIPYSRYIIWLSDAVVPVSQAMAVQFPEGPKIQVIHDGFSMDEFQISDPSAGKNFRNHFNLEDNFVIGCVGRIKFHRKGQEVLVRAAGILKTKGRQFKVLIVGSPFPGNESHLEALKSLIRDLKLEENVVLTGDLADVKPAYQAINALVLPSAQPEPFGGVVMEAMAMGLPVIATNIGGSVDQVVERETGFLVPPSAPPALADKIEELMDNPTLRTRMGQAGMRRIAEHFSLAGMVKSFETLYEQCINRRSK